jgi:hypothetical protein
MTRFEVQQHGANWIVIDRETGNPVHDHPGLRSRLEAQALADFRTGLAKPVSVQMQSPLDRARRLWKAVLGSSLR